MWRRDQFVAVTFSNQKYKYVKYIFSIKPLFSLTLLFVRDFFELMSLSRITLLCRKRTKFLLILWSFILYIMIIIISNYTKWIAKLILNKTFSRYNQVIYISNFVKHILIHYGNQKGTNILLIYSLFKRQQ